jgi:uncharacterized protein (UPF0332 family)
MYYAALAVFVERGLAVPKSHSGVVTRLSRLDRDESLGAKADVARLSRALERRLIADYDAEDTLTIEHARRARDDCTAFVAFCERLVSPA